MKQPVSLPLEYAAQIVFELHSMRGECIEVANHLVRQGAPEASDLDECALLDEALARAHHALRGALEVIKAGQAKRRRSRR